jgi:hypothetical protein
MTHRLYFPAFTTVRIKSNRILMGLPYCVKNNGGVGSVVRFRIVCPFVYSGTVAAEEVDHPKKVCPVRVNPFEAKAL